MHAIEKDYSNVRVYAKHLQSATIVHQACIGDWTHQNVAMSPGGESIDHFDVVFGKGTYLSLYRFLGDEADIGRPTGTLEHIHEQPVFGTIKDIKTLFCSFEEAEDGTGMDMDIDQQQDIPRLGYIPKASSSTVLVVTSDSGVLSFLTFHYNGTTEGIGNSGYFRVLKEVEIAEPGFDCSQTGAKIAVDPSSRIMAISALENHIKLVILRSTTRAKFDPVERISNIDLKGTIIDMEFLTPDPDDEEENAILAVLFYNKDTSKYHIATFHIGLKERMESHLAVQVGTSQLASNPTKSVLLLKALPNLPCSMVYIDEEKISLVTVERPQGSGPTVATKHTHRSSLQLLKRETVEGTSTDSTFPLISACATPPRSLHPISNQTLYLGSDTSELYRINIHHLTYSMQFELISGERPVGNVMLVLARRQTTIETPMSDAGQDIVFNTDYVLYSSDQGDGGILAVKEEEGGIDLFAITELQNSSPILDFCIQEPTFPGRDSLYICSGMKQEGSIKRIRSGIPAESSGSGGNEFFAGTTGLWSIKENQQDVFDSFLVVSFVQSTTLMKTGDGGSLEDISENSGLDLKQATVGAGRLKDGTVFQAHRNGVIAVDLQHGARYEWSCHDSVITSVQWAKESTLVLGQISSGSSNLLVLALVLGVDEDAPTYQFKVVASKSLDAEPTAIHCWREESNSVELDDQGEKLTDVLCCVGTLEPAVLVFKITPDAVRDVYRESLAQAGRESVAIPHTICILEGREEQRKILVGLRDGSVIAYDWNNTWLRQDPTTRERVMSSPRLFKLGVLPVKFVLSYNSKISRTLILSDSLWQASFGQELQVQPILFDSEVSQACSFDSGDEDPSRPGYIFVVDHHDMQLVTLDGIHKYNYQTLALGHTPRRILDVTSKRLLLSACVKDGFPFAASTLLLIDPGRVSNEPGLESQHIVAEFALKQGEAVYCLVEWRIPRPNKSDAVYICVGTGLFSPTGSEVSAATPKTGRLVVLSVKQSKKTDRKSRKFELDLRWAMSMPAPVFAISAFMSMKLLISNGPVLKLLALDLEKKTLVERASHRERWPIVQISSQGSMICTGSRRESICFYEYQAGLGGERSFDRLRFLKSARATRIVSDCIAISPEFAVGVDMSGGIFGLGYSPDEPNCQHSLVDRFSFHLGEVVNRIRIAKIWPADERSLAGISLSQRASIDQIQKPHRTEGQSLGTETASTGIPTMQINEPEAYIQTTTISSPSSGSLSSCILLPWTSVDSASSSSTQMLGHSQSTQTSAPERQSSQALIACTLTGSILGFWRLQPQVYQILSSLQSAIQATYECRPVAGNIHERYRSLSSPALHTVDGDLMDRFLQLDHGLQVQLLKKCVGLSRMVEDWLQQCNSLSPQERVWMTIPGPVTISGRGALLSESVAMKTVECAIHSTLPSAQQEHGWCRTAAVICRIIAYLQSLDWHQQ